MIPQLLNRSPLKLSLPIAASLLLVAGITPLCAQITESDPGNPGTVHIRVTRPAAARPIPETLFASFLEPIRQSTYGGLWADAVENPSFEDGLWSAQNSAAMLRDRPELIRASELGLPLPWEPLDQAQGSRYAPIRGDAANSYQSLLIMSLPGKEVGILERIYLPVERELNYNGSIFLKHVEGPTEVRLSLRRRNHHDQVLATTTIIAASTEWARYAFTLNLRQQDVAPLEPVDLVLSLSDDARAQVDNLSLMPADAVEGMDPEVLSFARELQSPLVRFGGNFTSHYDWHDGIGPRDKRISKLNLSWGIPEYNTFGTDEFLTFCRLIHSQPQIALNLGTGTPQQAAEWVKYVNDHWGDHQGGNLWELGNELWGDFQVGYPSLERVAAKTLATSQAIRAVDPRARLIATGGDEDSFHDWNAQQLSTPPDTFNYLSTHFVVGDNVQLPRASTDFRIQAALAMPWGLGERMQAIRQQIAQSGRPEVKVAFTEWLITGNPRSGPNFANLGGALFAGGFLNMLLRNSDAIAISDMTGIIDFAGIQKQHGKVFGTPAYWVLRSYSSSHPRTLLTVQSDGPTYTVSHGVNRLPAIQNVPYLDVVAAESADNKSLLLFCVNRHLTRAATAELDLTPLSVKPGSAKITTITGETIYAANEDVEPEQVFPQVRTQPATGKLTHTFPSKSITIIEIAKT